MQKQRFFCGELANAHQLKELKGFFFAFAQSLLTSASLVASIVIILTTKFCQNESQWVLYCSRSLVPVLEACLPIVGVLDCRIMLDLKSQSCLAITFVFTITVHLCHCQTCSVSHLNVFLFETSGVSSEFTTAATRLCNQASLAIVKQAQCTPDEPQTILLAPGAA